MGDDVTRSLERLAGALPEPRTALAEAAKDELVRRVGPRTARDVVKAKSDFPLRRIPFLFSSVDTQDVVDLLANDVAAAIERALSAAKPKPRRR